MDTNARVQSVVSLVTPASSATAEGDYNQDRPARDAERQTRYRLVIEEGPKTGTFIYKTLDSETGEVLRQYPREQLLKMSEDGRYSAGALIDTII
jgi:flagellar protein FlaG